MSNNVFREGDAEPNIDVAINVDELVFFHGTGAYQAQRLVCEGSKDLLAEVGAYEVAQQVCDELSRVFCVRDPDVHSLVKAAGDVEVSPFLTWVLHKDRTNLFRYGEFFVTLNFAVACRYALRTKRSEFLSSLAVGLEILSKHGSDLPARIRSGFPEVDRLLAEPSSPVVIEITGLSIDRLRPESGPRSVSEIVERHFSMLCSGATVNTSFGVRDMCGADVVAVYEMAEWMANGARSRSWRPDPVRLASARVPIEDWLAGIAFDGTS